VSARITGAPSSSLSSLEGTEPTRKIVTGVTFEPCRTSHAATEIRSRSGSSACRTGLSVSKNFARMSAVSAGVNGSSMTMPSTGSHLQRSGTTGQPPQSPSSSGRPQKHFMRRLDPLGATDRAAATNARGHPAT
jgi:hypothetical protein